ncbi:hypothetical protein DFO66_103378 [Brevibacterium sanguinis]|uniref:SPP1 gp7 family phage head morphogenesis protein n=2 Tax=Brevibacterium TaxID=1696 RepID=A0A366IN20_9MICO|nr:MULTISPECIES: hypothetical protein [Brevibacterium]RBP66428.1 hypothetical protein DFO66_103378 [Brevibacterium sanguinis]RBP73080.1 hypothetical protein DFO65_103378 [Brevibacterium celere]
MATKSDVVRFRLAQEELERFLKRDIRILWSRVKGSSPDTIRDAFLEATPSLVGRYGGAAAVVGAEYFEGLTGLSAVLAEPIPDEAVQASVRFFAGGLYDNNPNGALNGFLTSGSRHMLQYGRSTVYESTRSAPGWGYARVPEAGACKWCLMLSSRGAVYATERSAGGEGNDFHDDCRCDPTVAKSDDDLPYDVKGLYETYLRGEL